MVRMIAVSLTTPCASIQCAIGALGAGMHARERGVAAEDCLALALEAGAQRVRQRRRRP